MYNPQLDTFMAVVETGSFAKAAQALFIGTPAVIKKANALKDRLGLKLPGDMAMILYSFLEEDDLSGKTIAPSNTRGGSGFSGAIRTIRALETPG